MKNLKFNNTFFQWPKDLARLKVLGVILLISLCVFIYIRLDQDTQNPFPVIAKGTYLGKIVGLNIDPENPVLHFSAEFISADNLPKISVFNQDWDSSNPDAVSWLYNNPLLLKSKNFFLRLIAGEDCLNNKVKGNYSYCGRATNLNNGQQGFWYLSTTVNQPVMEAEQKMIVDSSSARSKALKVDEFKVSLDSMKAEAQKLSIALQDAESIKNRSDSRYSSQQLKISELKDEIEKEESILQQLQGNFEIAKSVAPHGRVTSLARQVLMKEFDILSPKGIDPDKLELIEKAKKAREILALKRQVESLE